MNKMQVFLKKHSSTILTVVGSVGVVTTSVLAVKATPKATKMLDEAKEAKGGELTVLETIQVAWKPYIPATISGVSTIACICGIHCLSTRNQASLMSAYAALENSYKAYRQKVEEIHKDDNVNIDHEIVKSKIVDYERYDMDKELFFDIQSMRYFESTFENVKLAELTLNQRLMGDGVVSLNDYYELLCIPGVSYGNDVGWSTVINDKIYANPNVSFVYEKTETDDGLECWIIRMPNEPSLDFLYN